MATVAESHRRPEKPDLDNCHLRNLLLSVAAVSLQRSTDTARMVVCAAHYIFHLRRPRLGPLGSIADFFGFGQRRKQERERMRELE